MTEVDTYLSTALTSRSSHLCAGRLIPAVGSVEMGIDALDAEELKTVAQRLFL